MFGLFKKKPALPRADYQVFMTEVDKYRFLIDKLKSFTPATSLIYHFEDTKEEMSKLLTASCVAFSQFPDTHEQVVLLSSKDYLNSAFKGHDAWILEIHPLPNQDAALLELQGENPPVFYTALDSPFFKMFGGERLQNLMEKMGVDRSESVAHTMLSKSIERAQLKIAGQVQSEVTETSSIEKWIEVNRVSV